MSMVDPAPTVKDLAQKLASVSKFCAEEQIDPGNEPSKPKPHSLEWVMDFVRRHPGATTSQGEANLLVQEIDRLRRIINEALGAIGDPLFPEP